MVEAGRLMLHGEPISVTLYANLLAEPPTGRILLCAHEFLSADETRALQARLGRAVAQLEEITGSDREQP
jgi:hypothetical protein